MEDPYRGTRIGELAQELEDLSNKVDDIDLRLKTREGFDEVIAAFEKTEYTAKPLRRMTLSLAVIVLSLYIGATCAFCLHARRIEELEMGVTDAAEDVEQNSERVSEQDDIKHAQGG